jgi:selenocysteine lyase/cysteine desulfurase
MGSAQIYLDGLFDYMLSSLASLPLVTVIGDPPARLPVVSIAVNGVPAEKVVQRLADNGILAVVNPTSRALDALGVEEIGGALTLGLAHYSTMAEVDHLVRSLASLG